MDFKQKTICLALGGMVMFSAPCFSGAMGEASKSYLPNVIIFSGNADWTRLKQSETIELLPDVNNYYYAAPQTSALVGGELFFAWQRSLMSQMLGQVGVAVAATNDARINGVIWQDQNPQFDALSYAYKINHIHVALKGRLVGAFESVVQPYVQGSVGVGFNRSHSYGNTSEAFEVLPSSNFASNTETAFTYTAGAGLQTALSAHWQLGIGYEFADWGQSQLNRAPGQTMNSGLSLAHLYTNAAQFNVSYVA